MEMVLFSTLETVEGETPTISAIFFSDIISPFCAVIKQAPVVNKGADKRLLFISKRLLEKVLKKAVRILYNMF